MKTVIQSLQRGRKEASLSLPQLTEKNREKAMNMAPETKEKEGN